MSRSPAKGASSEIAIDTALKARGPSASESSNKGYDRPLFPDLDVCLQVSSSLENPVAKYGLRVNGQPKSCIEISRRRTEVMSFVRRALGGPRGEKVEGVLLGSKYASTLANCFGSMPFRMKKAKYGAIARTSFIACQFRRSLADAQVLP